MSRTRSRSVRPRRGVLGLSAAALLVGSLAACSGDDGGSDGGEDGESVADVLGAAKERLDETPGVELSIATDEFPEDVEGVSALDGVANRQPAFEGTISGRVSGFPAAEDVPVVSLDDVLYVDAPVIGLQELDAADTGAPDPADFLDPETGFSAILPLTQDAEAGESARGGEDNSEILTEYSGTIPGAAVQFLVPSAEGDFEAVHTVDDENVLRSTRLTGVFYADTEPMTYDITIDAYDVEEEIAEP